MAKNKPSKSGPSGARSAETPAGAAPSPSYDWHFEVLPITARPAGFEWGTGCYINAVPPEEAARRLRESIP